MKQQVQCLYESKQMIPDVQRRFVVSYKLPVQLPCSIIRLLLDLFRVRRRSLIDYPIFIRVRLAVGRVRLMSLQLLTMFSIYFLMQAAYGELKELVDAVPEGDPITKTKEYEAARVVLEDTKEQLVWT